MRYVQFLECNGIIIQYQRYFYFNEGVFSFHSRAKLNSFAFIDYDVALNRLRDKTFNSYFCYSNGNEQLSPQSSTK